MGLKATVVGASGYSGGEILRLLAGHPALSVVAAGAHSRAGKPLGRALPHLIGYEADLVDFEAAAATQADVCFSCLPGGELGDRVEELQAEVIVDLSDEHRGDESWVYGLSEFARTSVTASKRIANPGCYPTATLLALIPFARAGLIEAPVVVDAMSGVSGAGRKAEDRLAHATVSGSIGSYGAIPHRHVEEMERALAGLGGMSTQISFTPHLVPMPRGLLATVRSRLRHGLTDDQAVAVLRQAYENEPFIHVSTEWPTTKAVSGSNAAVLSAHVDERAGWLVASAAIDNLGKGAAGQAIQNANLALGLEETAGLSAVGVWP